MSQSSSRSGKGRGRGQLLPSAPITSFFPPATSIPSVASSSPDPTIGSSRPASPTAEAPSSTKRLQSGDDDDSIVAPSLDRPLSSSLRSLMQEFPSTPRISRIREYNPSGSLREDVEAAMGVLEQLSTWFSNSSTVSYLAGNAGLTKKLGHRFGALLSAIDKLPGSSTPDPSGVYAEGSSSHPDVAESTPNTPSTPPRPSTVSRDQDTTMATPRPPKRRSGGTGSVPVPPAPPPSLPAPVR